MNYYVYINNDDGDLSNHYETFAKKNELRADSGLDLVCPCDLLVPAKATSFKIKLGIQGYVEYIDKKVRGYYLYPRSSMGSKTSLRQSNSIGLIDFGYRGEVMLVVDNVGDKDYQVKKGDRLCQLVAGDASPIHPVVVSKEKFMERVENEKNGNERGTGGFGSTGV